MVKLEKITNTGFEIFLIENEIEGVNIPCVVAIPKNMSGIQKATLIFNNESGQTLTESSEDIIEKLPNVIEGLEFKTPIIIPILPSKQEFSRELKGIDLDIDDPKQFGRMCFDSKIPEDFKFYRINEQVSRIVNEIINDRELQRELNILEDVYFDKKVIGFGHSGAGAAMLRFAMLQPELLDTLIIGGNGDILPTPISENKLNYPFGVKDFSLMFGKEFNEAEYRKINFQFYIGDREDSKTVYDTIRDSNYGYGTTGENFAPENLATEYKDLYGHNFFERFKNVLKDYEKNGLNIGLKIYPKSCHSIILLEDLHGIMSGKKTFNKNCSMQVEKMLDDREEENSL